MNWIPDVEAAPQRTMGWKTVVAILAVGVVALMAWMWPEPTPPTNLERVAAECSIEVDDLTFVGKGHTWPVSSPYGTLPPKVALWYEDTAGEHHALRMDYGSEPEHVDCNAEGY